MKKLISATLIIILLFSISLSISSCKKETPKAIKIEPMTINGVKLSDKEQDILTLTNTEKDFNLFEYSFDDTATKIEFNVWLLDSNKKWKSVFTISDTIPNKTIPLEGKIAITHKNNKEFIIFLSKGENNKHQGSFNSTNQQTKFKQVFFNSSTKVVKNKEIPFLIEVFSDSKEPMNIDVNSYYETEKLIGYDYVYAVTALIL